MAKQKVVLDYDPQTGELNDVHGTRIAVWSSLDSYPYSDPMKATIDVEELISLKEAGFSTNDIIRIKKAFRTQ